MKRKGRKHVPKVGTRPSDEMEMRDRREESLHPFAADPRRHRGGVILAVIAAVLLVIGFLAFIFAT
jgi:hypothetical protein